MYTSQRNCSRLPDNQIRAVYLQRLRAARKNSPSLHAGINRQNRIRLLRIQGACHTRWSYVNRIIRIFRMSIAYHADPPRRYTIRQSQCFLGTIIATFTWNQIQRHVSAIRACGFCSQIKRRQQILQQRTSHMHRRWNRKMRTLTKHDTLKYNCFQKILCHGRGFFLSFFDTHLTRGLLYVII